jgi:glycerophosphoryl diester phosphodiesterase
MTLPEIRMIANGNPDSRLNQMMTLEEFVSLVNGKVGVIFEIKVPYENSADATVDAVLSVLTEYRGEFAIHSSNPYVIRRIRTLCPDIAVGQISLSFKWIPNVSPEYVRLHREFLFADIIMPDFLDYDIRDLAEGEIRDKALNFCRQHGMPLLSWTIKNATEEHLARKYCSNYIIEGATSYIN